MLQLGTVQTVVVCLSASSGFQGACPIGQVESVTQSYLVSASEASRFELGLQPFDPATAGAFFGYAFVSTLVFYLFCFGIGSLISLIKK